MMKSEVTVAPRYNRCIAFTLPSGKVIEVKVMGDKVVAAADAKQLLDAFTVPSPEAPAPRLTPRS